MPVNKSAGPTFDHAYRPLMSVLAASFGLLFLVFFVLIIYDHHHGHPDLIFPFPFVGVIPIMVLGLQPRWQLTADGLVDLRKWKSKQLVAPYGNIQSVRVVKTGRKAEKWFEIVTSQKTIKADILQGDQFLTDLSAYLPPSIIVGSSKESSSSHD